MRVRMDVSFNVANVGVCATAAETLLRAPTKDNFGTKTVESYEKTERSSGCTTILMRVGTACHVMVSIGR